LEKELNFFLNELINYFPNRISFPSKKVLFSYLTKKGIIPVSNYLDFDDFISYQNATSIVGNINSHSIKTRFYCIYACSFFKNPKCSQDLLSMINDPDDTIRAIVIYTLGELKVLEAVPNLLGEIDNNSNMVVNEIIIAFGKIKDPICSLKLEDMLIKKEFTIQAIITIGKLAEKDGLKIIFKYIKNGDKNEKCAAIYSSLHYKSKKLNQLLLNLLESADDFLANIIVYILGEKKVEIAVKDIIYQYIEENISEEVAFNALLKISKRNVNVAISLLKDNDPPTRLIAAKILAELNNQSVVLDIIEALNNEYIFTIGNMIKESEESGSEIYAFDDIFILEEFIKTLCKLGGEDALIAIDKACSNEYENVSTIAKESLAIVIEKENNDILIKNLDNISDSAKKLIIEKILKNNLNNYTEIIFEYLTDTNKDISYLSSLYLGKNEDKRAIGKLSEIIGLNNSYSDDAKKYLKKMGF